MYKIYNFDMSKIEIYNYSKPSFGLNYNEFTAYCRTQKQIILDDYFFRKLNEFYIYANKGFYVDEVIEKEYYKLVHSYFVKDHDCNYVIDVKDKENFAEIENDVEQEMKKINAEPCYIITPLSDLYAMYGAKLIFKNIREAYNNADNMEAKSNMLLGAFYGGVAITGSGTTAVHALSYPLGGKYHIAHGVSNAILFAHVMEFNKDACKQRLAMLCDVVEPTLIAKSVDEKAQYIIEQITDIVKVTNIPTDLKEFGVKMEDLDFLVDAGSKQTRLLVNNMKELSLNDIREIYLKVLKP